MIAQTYLKSALTIFAVLFLLVQLTFAASPHYEIIDLGTLGGDYSCAYAINEVGQVVGISHTDNGDRAFLWDSSTGMIDLGMLPLPVGGYSVAYGINDAGQVVGYSGSDEGHAFYWDIQSGMIDLGAILGSGDSEAWAINNAGQVVGIVYGPLIYAFLWQNDNGVINLGSLGSGYSIAYAINEYTQVVGASQSVGGPAHAFIWDSINGMRDIGTLGGSVSKAYGINDHGQVVGEAQYMLGYDEYHAFLWDSKRGKMDLGPGKARAINNVSQVVGYLSTGGPAFYWDIEVGKIPLSDLLPANSGWIKFVFAYDINNRSQIVGQGITNSGKSHAFLMTPAPPKIIYVDGDATGANDGSSWDDAFNYLQDALATAWSGDEIRVAQGVYKPDQGAGQTRGDPTASFQLKNGVALKGGYAGLGQPDPNVRDVKLYESILSGDLYDDDDTYGMNNNSRCVVCVQGLFGFSAVLDCLIVTAGYINADIIGSYNGGAGLRIDGTPNITIVNCTFTRNYARGSGYNNNSVDGAAIATYYGSPVISNCTFRDNHVVNQTRQAGGAALWCYQGNPVVTDCEFIQNTAIGSSAKGAGIWTYKGNTTVSNCTFRDNHVEGKIAYGAGLWNNKGDIVVTDCEFIENTAVGEHPSGAGLWNHSGNITVTDCSFIDNFVSGGYSGAAMVSRDGDSTITRCIFTGNHGAENGGGLFNDRGSPTVTYCIFTDNSADRGGGMYSYNGIPKVRNCLFAGNSSEQGGALWNYEGAPNIVNCTFTSNTATQKGGGIWNYEGNPSIGNTIMWLNIDQDGTAEQSQIYNYSGSPLISHSWIARDPLFLDPENCDYHLNHNSPCINAGDPNYMAEPNETDLDAKPRIIACRIDMGVFEYDQLVSAEVRIVPRTFNLASKGNWITCYIWPPEQYNAADIEPNSIFLMCEIEPEQFTIDEQQQLATAVFNREDVQTILDLGDIDLTITGRLTDGTLFEGIDVIKVIEKTGKN
jgi:probable HAF family extracellular repeat protein